MMTPYYSHKGITIYHGDALEVLKAMEAESVQCCVTSPPYWGLRDYGTAKWEGGSPDCDHKIGMLCSDKSTLAGYTSENIKLRTFGMPVRDICPKCGAIRIDSQLGLETTPEEYVAKMVQVFREVKRVLKKDGTLWLNLGDTYSAHKDCKSVPDTLRVGGRSESANIIEKGKSNSRNSRMLKSVGLKNKDLIGIPWRVAFALQADGWYLRSDIIWAKPNPMPESVTDRPTKSHEYIFLISKSARYYYDAEAVKETATSDIRERTRKVGEGQDSEIGTKGCAGNNGNRNRRSVWTVTTKPYKEAHFATFPPDLIVPCIKAGSRKGDVVLDPFGGSMTTAYVAKELSRKAVMIELNEEYIKIGTNRLAQEVLNF